MLCYVTLFYSFFILIEGMFVDFFRERGRESTRKEEKHLICCLSHMPWPGTEPTTPACALTGNQTCDLLVYGTVLQPTELHRPRLYHPTPSFKTRWAAWESGRFCLWEVFKHRLDDHLAEVKIWKISGDCSIRFSRETKLIGYVCIYKEIYCKELAHMMWRSANPKTYRVNLQTGEDEEPMMEVPVWALRPVRKENWWYKYQS